MKKILVLVMVLMLVGCDSEVTLSSKENFIIEQNEEILELLKYEDEEMFEHLFVAVGIYEDILDRLDTIDMNIDRIEAENMNNIECVIDMLDEVFDGISNDIEWVEGMVYDKDNQVVSIYRSDGTLSIEFAIYEMYDSWCN
jgi:hypothetical protein